MRRTKGEAREANNAACRRYRKRHPERANKSTKDWRNNNKEEHREMCRDWQRRCYDPVRQSANRRKSVYGITQEAFDAMLVEQDNRCLICRRVFETTPYVDHSHENGENRGLLCRRCNLLLGNARDSVQTLTRAICYLMKCEVLRMKKHHFSHTKIEHHHDGSATVHHVHESGDSKKDVKHAVPSLDHVHDSLQNHLGAPNPGEAEADAGQHGVPAEHAVPAGLPMAPPPAAGGAPGGMGA